jgi:hypothetical protein
MEIVDLGRRSGTLHAIDPTKIRETQWIKELISGLKAPIYNKINEL